MKNNVTLPYSPTHSEQWLETYFKKNFVKKNYGRFDWWKSYLPKNKPLHVRCPFRDRILNGDFEYTHYKFEAELVEYRLNKKYQEWGFNDPGRFENECAVDKARRKRLLEDYDKEEKKRLEELRKEFVLNIKMTYEEYDLEVVNTEADSLIEFYYEMVEKYKLRARKLVPVPNF